MNCLHCGDCCLRMSPLSAPEQCPHIIQDGTFFFCSVYNQRPEECANHKFPARHCPIGIDKLGFINPQQIAQRIDDGWALCNSFPSVHQRRVIE